MVATLVPMAPSLETSNAILAPVTGSVAPGPSSTSLLLVERVASTAPTISLPARRRRTELFAVASYMMATAWAAPTPGTIRPALMIWVLAPTTWIP
ncbi:hypothetical protein D3C72_1551490 [compost metagenome]